MASVLLSIVGCVKSWIIVGGFGGWEVLCGEGAIPILGDILGK
jgi:hypothetical protein